MSINWIQTKGGLHITLSGVPRTVAKDSPHYEKLVQALPTATEAEVLEILDAEILALSRAIELTPDIQIRGGVVYYKEDAMNPTLSERILQMHLEGFDLSPMVNFIEKLMKNPSRRVVQHLYSFLEVGKQAITPSGNFVAYKAIRNDWRDIHSGTMDNSIGATPTMQRNQVDEDPNQTCSYGLHVCSWDYLAFFARGDGRVVECEISPADVVAIPADYNNTKMRVCTYKVTRDLTEEWKKAHNVLESVSVRVDLDAPFHIQGILPDGEVVFLDEFSRLVDAAEALEAFDDDQDEYVRIELSNAVTGAELDYREFDVDFDEDEDEDDEEYEDTFYLYGLIAQPESSVHDSSLDEFLDSFSSMNNAMEYALDELESGSLYVKFEIRDDNDSVLRTIS